MSAVLRAVDWRDSLRKRGDRFLGDEANVISALRSAPDLAGLVRTIDEGIITKQIARDVFIEMFASGKSAAAIIEEKGLKAEPQDAGELEQWCREAIATNDVAAQQVRDGNEKAINSFIGPVMKASRGKANPKAVREMLLKIIQG